MNQPMVGVAIAGVAGRMGRMLLQGLCTQKALQLQGALVSAHSSWVGQDVGKLLLGGDEQGILCTTDLSTAMSKATVLIDFSQPQATSQHVAFCQQQKKSLVIGTTGLSDAVQQQIVQAAKHIAILQSANFSFGVQLLYQLATLSARCLGAVSDIDIIERHHRHKRDIPSGTALELAAYVARAADLSWPACCQMLQKGLSGEREPQKIHLTALRAGEEMGEHTIQFTTPTEQLSITHQANSRLLFAEGALQAAQWLSKQPEGLYHLSDMQAALREKQ